MSWCERTKGVDYVIGLARNARLEAGIARQMRRSRSRAAVTGVKSRRFRDFRHRTQDSWSRARRVIGKAEALPGRGAPKPNARFIVTSLPASEHSARKLYEGLLLREGRRGKPCERPQNRPVRRPLLVEPVRRQRAAAAPLSLRPHPAQPRRRGGRRKLARAALETLRLRLLKIGARVRMSVRRIHFALSGACPDREAFAAAWMNLAPD